MMIDLNNIIIYYPTSSGVLVRVILLDLTPVDRDVLLFFCFLMTRVSVQYCYPAPLLGPDRIRQRYPQEYSLYC